MKKVLELKDERQKGAKTFDYLQHFSNGHGAVVCAWQDFSYRWKNLVDVVAISWSVSWVCSLNDWG